MNRRPRWVLAPLLALVLAPTTAQARDFYVDPTAGSADGDGSEGDPWRTLEELAASGALDDGTVSGGDRVLLRSGYHGELSISGGGFDVPVTIEPDDGAAPTLRRVLLRNTHGWVIRGLSISPSYAETYERATMIDLDGASCRDNVVEGNELFSERDVSGWSADDWVNRASSGIAVDGPDNLIAGNTLTNVRFGISVSGASVTVRSNVIENFSADGLRGLGDYDVFEYNYVANSYADGDVDDNHDDGFQSWSVGEGGVGTGEVVGVVLRGNVFIGYSDPDQPFRGTLQGIGCFDGFFVDWVIENNVVATDHWHGITLLGARGARIVNNTVLDLNEERPGPPWIQIQPHKDGTPSEDCVVRNNLVTDLDIQEGTGMVEDHNLVMSEPSSFFVDVGAHDYHLIAGAMAIDMGTGELAPSIDRDGVPRPVGSAVDLGAYEWAPPGTDVGTADGAIGALDAGPRRDGGTSTTPTDGGCGCRAGRRGGAGWLVLLGALFAIALFATAQRRRRG